MIGHTELLQDCLCAYQSKTEFFHLGAYCSAVLLQSFNFLIYPCRVHLSWTLDSRGFIFVELLNRTSADN